MPRLIQRVAFVAGDSGVLAPGRWGWARALGWMVLLFVVVAALTFSGWPRIGGVDPAVLRTVLIGVAYLAYAAAVRWGERRVPVEVAPRPLLGELAIGCAIGAGMFALVFASLRLGGAYTMAPGVWTGWQDDILGALRAGFAEELLVRLIVFRLLVRAFGTWPALLVSAALFGALHLANPNASAVAAIAIAVEAGLMLAAFYLLTGRIWVSVGVHAAWNFMQGPVFGASVSGHAERGSLFVSAPVPGVPDILTGGAFGPEASVSAIVVGAAVFAVVMRARRVAV